VAGAILVNYAKTYFTGALPEVWLYALGALFVLVTMFLPRGLVGLVPAREEEMMAVSDHILYLEHLTVSFDGFKALDGLTLYVEPGELRCIIGPNGAGKTTMMDVVTGKTRPDSGTAWFGNRRDLLTMTEPEIAQAGIGRKFQKPTVFELPHRLRESRTGARRSAVVLARAPGEAVRSPARSHRPGPRDHRAHRSPDRTRADARPRPEAVARDRDAAHAAARAAAR
jgi:hypothetical protein